MDWRDFETKKNSGWQLYDLAKDIGEKNNLAQSQPGVVAELTAAWGNWNKQQHGSALARRHYRRPNGTDPAEEEGEVRLGYSPTGFDPGNIFEPKDLPLGIGSQNNVFALIRSGEALEKHDPGGRDWPRRTDSAMCERFHHVVNGEVVGTQTVEIQPNSDHSTVIPRMTILWILPKLDGNLFPRDVGDQDRLDRAVPPPAREQEEDGDDDRER